MESRTTAAVLPRSRFRTLSVVALAYDGQPSAIFFAEAGFKVIGADVKPEAVDKVRAGHSHLPDLGMDGRVRRLVDEGRLTATHDIPQAVRESDAVLIMVPTPLLDTQEPDLSYIVAAGRSVAQGLRRGQLVILESTVYPGVTEEILRPELETSGLRAGTDFGLAYCPERYNPGDSDHTIDRTKRIVGGINEASARDAAELYTTITKGGVVIVSDIRTCEAAKIIENTQRDLNIGLMNEFALILEHLGLDVQEVLDAAATKWNFVPFRPGPGVGGHCLPKDPYYLVKTAQRAGYHAQIITAGRKLNDAMPRHVFDLLLKGLNHAGKPVKGARVAILGLSYKANIGDTRLSPSIELAKALHEYEASVVTVDPFVPEAEARSRFHSSLHVAHPSQLPAAIDAFVLMVDHPQYLPIDVNLLASHASKGATFVDGRRLVHAADARRAGLRYLGVGAGKDNVLG